MRQPDKNPIRESVSTVEADQTAQIEGLREGRPSLYTCPDCGGVLWQVREPEIVEFRCHVGHIVAGEQLFTQQLIAAENALWTAIRVLEDRMVLGRQLAGFALNRNENAAAVQFANQALSAEKRLTILRHIAVSGPD